jgi:hypothetical protein
MLGANIIPHNGNINNNYNRQRLSRIPPPPLPLFTQRTIHQQQTKNEKSESNHDNLKSAKDTDV